MIGFLLVKSTKGEKLCTIYVSKFKIIEGFCLISIVLKKKDLFS